MTKNGAIAIAPSSKEVWLGQWILFTLTFEIAIYNVVVWNFFLTFRRSGFRSWDHLSDYEMNHFDSSSGSCLKFRSYVFGVTCLMFFFTLCQFLKSKPQKMFILFLSSASKFAFMTWLTYVRSSHCPIQNY